MNKEQRILYLQTLRCKLQELVVNAPSEAEMEGYWIELDKVNRELEELLRKNEG